LPKAQKIILVLAVVAVVSAFLVAISIRAAKLARNLREAIQGCGESLGLSYLAKGDKEFVKAWAAIRPLSKTGRATNVLFGVLPSGLNLTAFLHQYTVSTGKSAHVVTHWVFAVDTPTWPRIEVRRRGAVAKWFRGLVGADKPDIDAPEGALGFERDWVVDAEDPVFANRLLTASVREALAAGESVAGWWFMGGKMAALHAVAMKPEALAPNIGLVERVWGAIGDEFKGGDATERD